VACPCAIIALQLDTASFGSQLRQKLFNLDADWTFINHGAFGAALVPALHEAHAWDMHTVRGSLLLNTPVDLSRA